MAKLSLTEEEEQKIKTILDFLFFDQYTHFASFHRFEQCFNPLFSDKTPIEFDTIFKEICGPKKKYITTERFLKSYLSFKCGKNISKSLKAFYETLFSEILKFGESYFIGTSKEQCYNYSTLKSCKNREFISNIKILTNKDNIIQGINVTYDDIFENEMFPSTLENELNISLDMNLGIIDEKPIKFKKIGKFLEIKEKLYRDSITHIFGNFDCNKNIITFLGFKCISGKTLFVGKPNSDNNGFLFGNFGKKFHLIKLQMNEGGINLLHPIFNENMRKNFFLMKKFENMNEKNIYRDDAILDEKLLIGMNNEEDIDKFIMTSLVEDNLFFNKKLEDDIPGNDYKDIVNRLPRKWIMNKEKMIKNKNNLEKINNINDAMKKFEKEKQIRGNNSFINNNENKNLKSNKNPLGKKTNKNNDIKRNKFRKKMKYRKFKYQDDKDNYYDTKKWNGDMGNMKHLNPEIFYKSKKNYIKLKNELARSIQKELLENNDNDLTQNKDALL